MRFIAAILFVIFTIGQSRGVSVLSFYYNDIGYQILDEASRTVYTYAGPKSGDVVVPQTVYCDGKAYTVVAIGGGTFQYSKITSVSLPGTIQSIGDGAFGKCKMLTNITLPNSITSIGESAFWETPLEEISIPNSVTSIGKDAFFYCLNLKKVTNGQSVKTIGDGAFQDCHNLKEFFALRDITTIGSHAFYECNSLSSITIGSKIQSIGEKAFYNCKSMKRLTIEDGFGDLTFNKEVYKYCPLDTLYIGKTFSEEYTNDYKPFFANESIKSLTIGDYVTEIPNGAFANCTGINRLTIGKSVSTIKAHAFQFAFDKDLKLVIKDSDKELFLEGPYAMDADAVDLYVGRDVSDWSQLVNKNKLEKIELGHGVSIIPNEAFSECIKLSQVKLPTFLKNIGDKAFNGCSILSRINIPESVESIGYAAFQNCCSLSEFLIPNSVSTIGPSVFYGCTELKSVILPENLTNIEYNTFYNCRKLQNCIIPNSVVTIGENAFYNCADLKEVNIPESVTDIGESAFNGCVKLEKISLPSKITVIKNSTFSGCSGLREVSIGGAITSIGSSAFNGCSNLVGMKIPESVTAIGRSAFSNCNALKEFTIPNAVTTIASNAFERCAGLEEVTIGKSVASIGREAFSLCAGIKKINIGAVEPPSLSVYVFKGLTVSQIYLYVPNGAKPKYKEDLEWQNFIIVDPSEATDIIVPEDSDLGNIFTNGLEMLVGGIKKLELIVVPSTASQDISFSSNNEEVATIDVQGQLIAIAEGECRITVSCGSFQKSFTVRVSRHLQTISWNQEFEGVYEGDEVELTAIASSGLDVEYFVIVGNASVSDSKLTVNSHGEIVVEASQPGNEKYLPAETVRKSFNTVSGINLVSFDDAKIALEGNELTIVSGEYALYSANGQFLRYGIAPVQISLQPNSTYILRIGNKSVKFMMK